MSKKPLDTKIPTIMQYIKTKVPKGGLMSKKLTPKVKAKRPKFLV